MKFHHRVGDKLEQDTGRHPSRPTLEDCPEHSHQQIPARPGEVLLLVLPLQLQLLIGSSRGTNSSEHDQQGHGGQEYLDAAMKLKLQFQ